MKPQDIDITEFVLAENCPQWQRARMIHLSAVVTVGFADGSAQITLCELTLSPETRKALAPLGRVRKLVDRDDRFVKCFRSSIAMIGVESAKLYVFYLIKA